MARIFISYSRVDVDFARQLAEALSNAGADVWIDIDDIPIGKKWSSAIQEGLNTSEVMLVVISPDSMASKNVEDEWQYFIDTQRAVITVRWRPAQMHYQLNRLQYADFYNIPFGTAFQRLLRELQKLGLDELKGSPFSAAPIPTTTLKPPIPTLDRPILRVALIIIVSLALIGGGAWLGLMLGGQGAISTTPIATTAIAQVTTVAPASFIDTHTPTPTTPQPTHTQPRTPRPSNTPTATLTPTPPIAVDEAVARQKITGMIEPLLAGEGYLYLYANAHEAPDPYASDSVKYGALYLSYNGTYDTAASSRMTDLGGAIQYQRPVFSPDGQRVAYEVPILGDDEVIQSVDMAILDINSGQHSIVLPDANLLFGGGLSWSPDGAFIALDIGNQGMAIYDVAADHLTRLPIGHGENIAWSPTGENIAFWQRRGSTNDADGWVIAIYNIPSGTVITVGDVNDGRGSYGPILWETEGNRLAFTAFSVADDAEGTRGPEETWVVNADGTGAGRLFGQMTVISQEYYPWLRVATGPDGGTFGSAPLDLSN